jgi:4-hydroxybenzoate polyprenyltransferase
MLQENKTPLYVDLDGTFTKSDLLFETFIAAVKSNPLIIILCVYWLLKGRSYLKEELSSRSDINVAILPLNPEFSVFLKKQKTSRKIILATASNEKIAKKIVDYFDVFDDYIGSTPTNNLKGKNKLEAIQQRTDNFAYAGNSSEDFILFKSASQSYLVNPTKKANKLAKTVKFDGVFDDQGSTGGAKIWIKQLRVHQWLKNLLIFVPVFVSGQFLFQPQVLNTIIAFFSFSFLASATYIINDLVDLDADRSHPRKKSRPLAACEISIPQGVFVSLLLFVIATCTAIMLGVEFALVLVAYLILTLLYSFKIKRYFGMDVIALASLYTVRIFAGAAVISVTVSFWLLSFSMFIFLSLALVKRCSELKSIEDSAVGQVNGRDYNVSDLPVLISFGSASSLMSILMFCFYINSQILSDQYQQLGLLWLIIPMLGYWLLRMWIKTARGEMHDDPIIFSLKDRGSIVSVLAMLIVAGVAQII